MDFGLLAFTDWICFSLKNPDYNKNTGSHTDDTKQSENKLSLDSANTIE